MHPESLSLVIRVFYVSKKVATVWPWGWIGYAHLQDVELLSYSFYVHEESACEKLAECHRDCQNMLRELKFLYDGLGKASQFLDAAALSCIANWLSMAVRRKPSCAI